MVAQAERKAALIINFSLQPSEVDNLTGYEVEALYDMGKAAGMFDKN